MSKGGRGLTPEEKQLWRGVTARVKARRKQAEPEAAPPIAIRVAPKPALKPKVVAPEIPRPSKAPPPQDRGAEKRVRRGKVEIYSSLDLHGHTQDSARIALRRFLRGAHARGDRTVVIVTGIGRDGEGILKRRLPDWLAEPDVRPIVSGLAKAHRAHGGAGAFYVFLKRPTSTRA